MPGKCLKVDRKPLVPLKTLDILFRRRYLPNTQFYFTNRKHAIPEGYEYPKRIRPFAMPKSEKLLSYIKYSDRKENAITKKRLAKPLHLKDNVKIAATRDLSERLFVKDEPDNVRAVVEIHPEFYTVIEGRPLRFHDDIKVYIMNIRGYAMLRQQIGYRNDLILKIDQNLADEIKEHDVIFDELKEHIKNFQKFLTEDYKRACAKVSKAERVFQELQAKEIEFLNYVTQITIMNNLIFKLDSIRNVLKTYRTYLLFAAPIYWRHLYDESFKRHSLEFEQGKFMTRSEEFYTDADDLVDIMDIDKIVEEARVELKNPPLPHMYYQTPQDMLYLFRTMELQSREYLTHLSKTGVPYRMLLQHIQTLKLSTKQELDLSEYYVDSIGKAIDREICNEMYLQEKFMRILHESFYDTIASPDTLKLKICIEYVYEQIFGKCEEGHQSLLDPMKTLEVMYEEYNLKLDSLDFKIVNQARADFFALDLKTMSDALHAHRALKEFTEMTDAMNKAFQPPYKFKRLPFKKFMTQKDMVNLERAEKLKLKIAAGFRVKREEYKVSAEDREDLLMFTEWCDGENPAPFLEDVEIYVKPTFEIESTSES